MSEITKLYKNAGVKKSKCWDDCNTCTRTSCDKNISYIKADYPPFTAEKQLSLIKLLSKYVISIDYDNGKYEVYILSIGNLRYDYYDTLEETLAYCINNLWQFLTEEDHKQIKEILK